MDYKDLMIGDWVYVVRGYDKHLTIEKVKGVIADENEPYSITIFTGETVSLNDIKPIPLTEEILVKNGLQKLNDKTFLLKNQIEIEVGPKFSEVFARYEDYDKDYNSYNNSYIEIAIIHYVHELQHLLRLMSIEKEIEV